MNRLLLALGCVFLSFAMDATASTPRQQSFTRTVVLVRHGDYVQDTAADKKLGPHLSPLGVVQAELAGAALSRMPVHFDHLYASPMHRARDTAMVIAADFPRRSFEVVGDLAECNPPTHRSNVTSKQLACKNKLDRVFAHFFKPATAGDQSDMLVCHGNVIRYLVARARGADPATWGEMSVGNASITTIRIEADGRFSVVSVGDAGHVPLNLRTGTHADVERDRALPLLPKPPSIH